MKINSTNYYDSLRSSFMLRATRCYAVLDSRLGGWGGELLKGSVTGREIFYPDADFSSFPVDCFFLGGGVHHSAATSAVRIFHTQYSPVAF